MGAPLDLFTAASAEGAWTIGEVMGMNISNRTREGLGRLALEMQQRLKAAIAARE